MVHRIACLYTTGVNNGDVLSNSLTNPHDEFNYEFVQETLKWQHRLVPVRCQSLF